MYTICFASNIAWHISTQHFFCSNTFPPSNSIFGSIPSGTCASRYSVTDPFFRTGESVFWSPKFSGSDAMPYRYNGLYSQLLNVISMRMATPPWLSGSEPLSNIGNHSRIVSPVTIRWIGTKAVPTMILLCLRSKWIEPELGSWWARGICKGWTHVDGGISVSLQNRTRVESKLSLPRRTVTIGAGRLLKAECIDLPLMIFTRRSPWRYTCESELRSAMENEQDEGRVGGKKRKRKRERECD